MRSGGVFSLEILDSRPGLTVFRATGPKANETFADEAGGHRFQRIPPNEKRGRVHTSTVTVAVLPEEITTNTYIDERDLEWSTCRGTGPGGQKRNKTESTVILTHRPTKIQVRCESERSQHQNRESALAQLKAKLREMEQNRLANARESARRGQVGSGMRGDKRRTIRYQDGQVTDHMTGKTWRLKEYLRGEW